MSKLGKSTKPKFCFVVSSPMTAKSFLISHIEALSKEFDITLVANFQDDKNKISLPTHLSIELTNIAISRTINPLQDLKCLIQLFSHFRKNHFEIIHSVTPKAGLLAMTAARFARVKFRVHIFTGQVWANKTGLSLWVLKCIDKLTHISTTHTLIDGKSQQTFLIKNKIVNESKTHILGKGSISGVDTELFSPSDSNVSAIKTQFGIPQESLLFVFLGRLNADKGLIDLFDALKLLHSRNYLAHLLVVGPIEDKTLSDAVLLLKSEYPNYFFHIDYTNEPQLILKEADIFCLPSLREGFGSSVLEAAASGLPAICSDTYGLRDAIVENETGLHHKMKDPESLFSCMKYFLDDKTEARRMGDAARKRVLADFTTIKITHEWVKFYQSIN